MPPVVLVLGAVATFAACLVGGLVGFATSLLLLPVLLLLGVPLGEAVTVNLVLAVVTRLPTVLALRRYVDVRRTATMLAGSVPGIGVGLVVVGAVPTVGLELLSGSAVLLSGIYLHRASPAPADDRAPRTPAAAVAGACSGALGVATSLNGVPPAVLLARSGAAVATRLADLSAFFVVGNCLTIAALAATRGVTVADDLSLLAVWLLAGVAGNAAGLRLSAHVRAGVFDGLTTGLVVLSGVVSLADAVRDLVG